MTTVHVDQVPTDEVSDIAVQAGMVQTDAGQVDMAQRVGERNQRNAVPASGDLVVFDSDSVRGMRAAAPKAKKVMPDLTIALKVSTVRHRNTEIMIGGRSIQAVTRSIIPRTVTTQLMQATGMENIATATIVIPSIMRAIIVMVTIVIPSIGMGITGQRGLATVTVITPNIDMATGIMATGHTVTNMAATATGTSRVTTGTAVSIQGATMVEVMTVDLVTIIAVLSTRDIVGITISRLAASTLMIIIVGNRGTIGTIMLAETTENMTANRPITTTVDATSADIVMADTVNMGNITSGVIEAVTQDADTIPDGVIMRAGVDMKGVGVVEAMDITVTDTRDVTMPDVHTATGDIMDLKTTGLGIVPTGTMDSDVIRWDTMGLDAIQTAMPELMGFTVFVDTDSVITLAGKPGTMLQGLIMTTAKRAWMEPSTIGRERLPVVLISGQARFSTK